jgi:AraC family transcriptional regulator
MEIRLPPGSSFGKVVRHRAAAGFTLSETTYAPGLQVPSHAHEHAFFYTVLEGDYTETFGRTVLSPRPLTLVFHPAGEVHSHRCGDGGGRCFNIDLAPCWIERLREYCPVPHSATSLEGGSLSWLATRLYRELREADPLSALSIEGVALEILAETSRRLSPAGTDRRPPRWLQQARDLLHERFAQPLTLDLIAGAVGVHPVHLARVFRRHYRCTIGDYVRQRRVDFACRRLAASDDPLVEIALAAGFSDQSQFCRTFRRLTGMTPSEFRAGFGPR